MTRASQARFVDGVKRAWALLQPRHRRKLRALAVYGVLIAGLDTVALLIVYALINVLNGQGTSGIAGSLVRRVGVGSSGRYHEALVLLCITAVLFVARSILSVIVFWFTVGATNAAQVDVIARLLRGHARAPQSLRHERNSSETLRTVLGSVDQVVSGVVGSSVAMLANSAVAVAVAIGLILASPYVAISVSIYFAVIATLWGRGIRQPLFWQGRRIQELSAQRYKLVMQGISAAKELQLRGRALYYAESAADQTRGINRAMRIVTVANGSLRYLLETALVIGAVLVVAVAGLTNGRDAALPAVGLVLAGAFRLLPALNQVLFLNNQVQFSAAAIGIVEQELSTFGPYAGDEPDATVPASTPHRFRNELQLRDVAYRYASREQPALRDVSFSVFAGESVGIVGPTGSGKSTLLDVLLGMLEPLEGDVIVDGARLVDVREAWQRSIGYVPQDVYLVDDTLRANVALGWYGEQIDDESVAEAVRLAGLADVVETLPERLETVLGERGIRLSGGQRQRVGLARALYTRPSVLVLDEATSNLDHGTERRIVDTLRALPGGVTIIFVTHRLESVRHCDRIVYLEQGTVRGIGKFDELTRTIPDFAAGSTPSITVG